MSSSRIQSKMVKGLSQFKLLIFIATTTDHHKKDTHWAKYSQLQTPIHAKQYIFLFPNIYEHLNNVPFA